MLGAGAIAAVAAVGTGAVVGADPIPKPPADTEWFCDEGPAPVEVHGRIATIFGRKYYIDTIFYTVQTDTTFETTSKSYPPGNGEPPFVPFGCVSTNLGNERYSLSFFIPGNRR